MYFENLIIYPCRFIYVHDKTYLIGAPYAYEMQLNTTIIILEIVFYSIRSTRLCTSFYTEQTIKTYLVFFVVYHYIQISFPVCQYHRVLSPLSMRRVLQLKLCTTHTTFKPTACPWYHQHELIDVPIE